LIAIDADHAGVSDTKNRSRISTGPESAVDMDFTVAGCEMFDRLA